MKLKRLAATVSASFDDALNRIENHEAVAECVIRDAREAVAKIQLERNRAQKELSLLTSREAEAIEAEERWKQRALEVAERDEAKALACLQRAEQSVQQQQTSQGQIKELQALVAELDQALKTAESQLQSLRTRRAALAARGAASRSRSKAQQIADEDRCGVFERWEAAVLTDELSADVVTESVDSLALEFNQAEESLRLKAQLRALRRIAPCIYTSPTDTGATTWKRHITYPKPSQMTPLLHQPTCCVGWELPFLRQEQLLSCCKAWIPLMNCCATGPI